VTRTGRRTGTSGSRESILAAAQSHFAAEGYDGATIRGIAASAGVDPALVRHYFGNKEHLFVAAMRFPIDPADFVPRILIAGGEHVGEELARIFFEAWDAPDTPFVALLRSVTTNEQAAQMLRQFISREVIGRLASTLDLDQPQLRAGLAGSQLVGLAFVRYVVRLEPIASMQAEALVKAVGPTLQRYLSSEFYSAV
jgi:AcrR family transcriptional regulator